MLKSLFSFSLLCSVAVAYAAAAPEPAPAPKTPAALVAILNSSAPQKEKADACRELARSGNPQAVPALAALLGDDALSHMARYALETIPGPAVDQALRDALQTVQGRNLVGVIGSIGVRRDARAVPRLAEFLSDPDSDVAQAAARSLGKIGGKPAVKALEKALPRSSGPNQLAVCEGLFRAAERFASARQDRQAIAIYDGLRKLESAPHQVKTAALRGAVLARGEGGLDLLLKAFRSEDFSQVDAAARIALSLPGEKTTRALTAELGKSSTDKQVLLISTLAKRGDTKAVPAILTLAESNQKPVSLEAIRVLPQFDDPSVVPVLLELVKNPDQETARLAQESLCALSGPRVDKEVMGMLASGVNADIKRGMEMANRRRLASAVPALFKIAGGPESELRVLAIRRIGDLGGAAEVPSLLDAMSRTQSSGEIEAAEQAISALCLKSANRDESVDRLAARMSNAPVEQKSALLRIMAAVGGPKALTHVRLALKDSQSEVRSEAIRALGSWSSPEAAPDLLEVARSATSQADKVVALRGYFALAKLGDVTEPQRLKMCAAATPVVATPEEKRLLLAALGEINSLQALKAISPYLADAQVKEEAATATVGIAERLLRRNDAAKLAPELMNPLRQAVDGTGNKDLAERAGKLLELAKSKAGQS